VQPGQRSPLAATKAVGDPCTSLSPLLNICLDWQGSDFGCEGLKSPVAGEANRSISLGGWTIRIQPAITTRSYGCGEGLDQGLIEILRWRIRRLNPS